MLQTNVAQLASCARVSRARVSAPEKTNAHRHLQTIRFGAPRRDEMTSSRERVAVVIVSHNSASWLAPCLSSVYAKSGNLDLDVVVVDSGSTDDTVDLVMREFPEVRVLTTENRGFAAANNRGLAIADSDWVLFLNPDTRILIGDARGARLAPSGTPDRGAGGSSRSTRTVRWTRRCGDFRRPFARSPSASARKGFRFTARGSESGCWTAHSTTVKLLRLDSRLVHARAEDGGRRRRRDGRAVLPLLRGDRLLPPDTARRAGRSSTSPR